MRPKIYLAGPMADYDNCGEWRKYAVDTLDRYGIQGVAPTRHTIQIAVNTSRMAVLDQDIIAKEKQIKRRDKYDVARCDGVIACFLGAEKASVGTCIELGWADAFDKPVIVVLERGTGDPHDHAMVRDLAWAVVPTLEEAFDLMASWMLP